MTIDEYIAAQPEKLQPLLISVRETICTVLPDAEERISYKMPTFWKRHNLIHFAAMKNEIEERGLKYSKGAIQFPYEKVDLELIGRIAEWCGMNNR